MSAFLNMAWGAWCHILGLIGGKDMDEFDAALDDIRAATDRLTAERDAARADAEALRRENEDLQERVLSLRETVARMEAAAAADKLKALNDHGEEKRLLEKQNDAQAARAMARNMKNDFVTYQKCVLALTDAIDAICRKNSITKKDLNSLSDLRLELRDVAGRAI